MASQVKVEESIPDIARRYGNLQCLQAVDAISSCLRSNNKRGCFIASNYPSYPVSVVNDIHGGMTIGYNRGTSGFNYKGIVYCNVIPSGHPEGAWLDNFHAVGTRGAARVPF